MDNIYVYLTKLPKSIKEVVTPCEGGYTVYIDENLDEVSRQKAYNHAVWHIEHYDFEKDNVQEIEYKAHCEGKI